MAVDEQGREAMKEQTEGAKRSKEGRSKEEEDQGRGGARPRDVL